MLVCQAHWQTSSQTVGPALHPHPPWDTSYSYVPSESHFSISWSCPASLSGHPLVLFSQGSDVVANKKTSSWGFGNGGGHSLISNLNARKKREAKRACASLLLTDTLHTWPLERQSPADFTHWPHTHCVGTLVSLKDLMVAVSETTELTFLHIHEAREKGGREGEAMLWFFYIYPEIWAFNLSLICTLLVATELSFTLKPSSNDQCYIWPEMHK